MKANFHTHTPRCHHAVGEEREYIEEAIRGGLSVLGFSDHTPYFFSDGYYSHFRMKPEELEGYVETVSRLKKEYENKIEIHVGLETEYYAEFFPEYIDFLKGKNVEYLILGQHFPKREMGEKGCVYPSDSKESLKNYVDSVVEALETGLFSYLAHPDLFNYVGEDHEFYISEMERLISAVKKAKVPLEFNLLGLRDHRNYPSKTFFELVAKENIPVILGSDAHDPKDVAIQEDAEKALQMLHSVGVTSITETIDMTKLKQHGI